MRGRVSGLLVVVAAGCGDGRREPPPPTAIGTVVCEPRIAVLGTGTDGDPEQATRSLQREVVAQLTDPAFLHRVASAEGVDDASLAGRITARAPKESRIVELGVALPDRRLATRICVALVGQLLAERADGEVKMLDDCAPVHERPWTATPRRRW